MRSRALCLALAAAAIWPAAARADGINGLIQLNFSKGDTETRDVSGRTTTVDSTLFNQQYRITLDKSIFPTLVVSAGGTFERSDVNTETDGEATDVVATRILPFVDLTLNTQLITLGGGYQRNEASVKLNGVSFPSLIREQMYGRFGYRPDGFPDLNVQAGRNEAYDEGKTRQYLTNDYLNISSQYRPVRNLLLTYLGTLNDGTDRLRDLERKSFTNAGTVTYSDSYWKNLLAFSGMYNISNQNSELITGGQGEVGIPRSASRGLSVQSNDPQVPLLPNQALNNGNTTPADATGIDIGYSQSTQPAWNLGLEFSPTAQVNTFHVWVDKNLSEVYSRFSWAVYTSDDNFVWRLQPPVTSVTFAPFDNRFEIRFQNVNSRYVKVVTKPLASVPLPPVINPSQYEHIIVTELQAFDTEQAADVATKDSLTSQSFTLDARVRLLTVPSLYYHTSYYGAWTTRSAYQYNMTNALEANHQFNPVLSGSAYLSRLDSQDQRGHQVTYTYGASLTAVPLPTLTHNLAYSGRTVEIEGGGGNFNSIYLTSTAQLYQGIDASLSGGLNFSSLDSGAKASGATWSAALNLIPYSTLNVNVSYSGTASEATGGGRPDTSSRSNAVVASASFTPFSTLYLYGDWQYSSQSGQASFTRSSYGVNWAPFPEGALHFSISYTETNQSSDNSTDRTLTPSVRWNISQRTSFDVAYTWFDAESDFQKQSSNFLTSNLRISF